MKTQKNLKHLLTGKELSTCEMNNLLDQALYLKEKRVTMRSTQLLRGYNLAMIFDKPSLRTRFSFSVAMRELGGDIVESVSDTRKNELPEDQARVLSGYCQAIMVRTFEDDTLLRMKSVAQIPIINGLSDLHHPCQIMADLLTLKEKFGGLRNVTLTYIGDGNNILHSLLLLAPPLGVNIHYCVPKSRGPNQLILQESLKNKSPTTGEIKSFSSPEDAAVCADAIYTDVWASMGHENKSADNLFSGFQVNEELMGLAHPHAIFMHCLPMKRGKEVSTTLPDQPCSVIFQQSENRLHVQKALLLYLLDKEAAANGK